MQYAVDAGIDYFAYCWYGENPGKRENEWQNHLHDLTYARKLHIQSKLKKKLKLCAIIGVGAKESELSEDDMRNLADEMKQEYYGICRRSVNIAQQIRSVVRGTCDLCGR